MISIAGFELHLFDYSESLSLKRKIYRLKMSDALYMLFVIMKVSVKNNQYYRSRIRMLIVVMSLPVVVIVVVVVMLIMMM